MSHDWQVSRSSGVGLLSGGAQCTGAVMRVPNSSSPSPICVARRLAGESHGVQCCVENVAAAVTGEHPSRAISAVCGRSESHDQQLRISRTESGNWAAPVGFVSKCRALLARDKFAPGDQTRAQSAVRDRGVECTQLDKTTGRR